MNPNIWILRDGEHTWYFTQEHAAVTAYEAAIAYRIEKGHAVTYSTTYMDDNNNPSRQCKFGWFATISLVAQLADVQWVPYGGLP